MSSFVYILELLDRVVSVDLRRGKAAVAQQFFYCVQVGAIVGKMGCETVP